MRWYAFLVFAAIGVAALFSVAAHAAPVNTTGHWRVQLTSGTEFSGGAMAFNQVGQTVIGHAGDATINGVMVSDTKMNATWNGPKGAGWMTIYFSASGNSFQGEWGYNGRKADGSFVGKRVASGG